MNEFQKVVRTYILFFNGVMSFHSNRNTSGGLKAHTTYYVLDLKIEIVYGIYSHFPEGFPLSDGSV